MSTNHNRIKVADLETNRPEKILKTNQNGEIEFSDVNNLKTESYNALDYTAEGKALDARQGKVLKDMIENVNTAPTSLVNDLTTGGTNKALTAEMGKTLENTKLTAAIATDAETQISSAVSEDKKVVSRSKLFNWWNWVKLSETLEAVTNRGNTSTKSICANGTNLNPVSFFLMRGGSIIAKLADIGSKSQLKLSISNSSGFEQASNMLEVNPLSLSSSTILFPITKNNDTKTLAIKDDFLKTPSGTETTAPIIIPSGVLTTVPQNGAIERDANGDLWETHNGARSKLITTNDLNIDKFLATTWKSSNSQTVSLISSANSTNVKAIMLPKTVLDSSDNANFLIKTFDLYNIRNSSYGNFTPPTAVTFEVFLKGNDCTFSGNQYAKMYSSKRTDIQTNQSIRHSEIALHTSFSSINGNPASSVFSFSSIAYDNYGNVSEENFNSYYLQALNGSYIKFSNASISLEYRVSIEFADLTNANLRNAECRPIFENYSTLFLKL